MDCETRTLALNLWDIETRITEIHNELDELHSQKEKLLGIRNKLDLEEAQNSK